MLTYLPQHKALGYDDDDDGAGAVENDDGQRMEDTSLPFSSTLARALSSHVVSTAGGKTGQTRHASHLLSVWDILRPS